MAVIFYLFTFSKMFEFEVNALYNKPEPGAEKDVEDLLLHMFNYKMLTNFTE